MSRRRASYAPYEPLTSDALYRQHYGEPRVRQPADATVLPERTADEEFADAVADALGYALLPLVVVAWLPLVRAYGPRLLALIGGG